MPFSPSVGPAGKALDMLVGQVTLWRCLIASSGFWNCATAGNVVNVVTSPSTVAATARASPGISPGITQPWYHEWQTMQRRVIVASRRTPACCMTSDPTESPEPIQRAVRVWDLPTRLFHWILALTVVGSLVTAPS